MSADILSEVLRAVRLTGAVFFSVDASAPWVAEAPAARELGPHILPGVDHVIEYHVVTAGTCWGGIVDQPPVQLGPGDVIVFPHGDPHVMSSAPGMRGVPDHASVHQARSGRLPVILTMDGGGPQRTQLICGFLGCDSRPFNPLLATLPRVMHLPRQAEDGGVLDQLVRLAVAESIEPTAGGECVLARSSELMFVDVVRRYLARLPEGQGGWLAGLKDEGIARVLGLLHRRPADPWSLEDLAREAALSRSVLAERFADLVGVPPMQYLAQWRMQLAANLLTTTTLSLLEVAERVGYGSEAALSRAFKRCVGVSPAEFRRGKRPEGTAVG